MLLELFVFFEIITIVLFLTAYFTKQEILWSLVALFSALLAFNCYNIETYVYQFNSTISAYSPILMTHSYPYLSGINFLIFGLALALGVFDLFDKYGIRTKKVI
jgi:hypothetical protein